MDRLTIPDVKVDAHTTRRTMIDAEAVKERAMEIYWKLKKFEDTGLTPAEVLSMSAEWCAMMSVLNSIGSYDRLRELAEADKEGRMTELVRRADVQDEIDRWLDSVGTILIGKGLSSYGELIGCLEDAPARSMSISSPATADVVPVVHGRWMHEETGGGFHIWKCSRCGRGMNDNPNGVDLYCYHCGAKMDADESEVR